MNSAADNTKTQAISAMLVASIAKHGGDVRKGLNEVLGEGTYEKLAGDVYDALRAKAR